MSVFFTNSLGVIDYPELQKLFYKKLKDKVAQSIKLANEVKSRYCRLLLVASPTLDAMSLHHDFNMNYSDISSWITAICSSDNLRSEVMATNLKKMLAPTLEDGTLTVGQAFVIIRRLYASTLLYKGSQIICNPEFSFSKEVVKDAMLKPDIVSSNKEQEAPLRLHMEYFYFEDSQSQRKELEVIQQEFIYRFFRAIKSYSGILSKEEIAKAFEDFV